MEFEIRLLEYVDPQSRSPFALWYEGLNPPAAAKVTAALTQTSMGNWSSVKGVGGGIFERKIDLGPGYRVYFGKDGDKLVLLLGGSSKQRQQQAIEAAQARWTDYRRRKASKKG
ncbi:MAG TPA: type II toxin-antitoxin system RelE/ParE family toxin [Nitrospiraceae bacterium]|nr:type II toxin-antitoxin system RelE/ParE family toxin [Nitrospiraceae bacterium]